MSMFSKLRNLGRNDAGAVVIETAFVVPALAVMAFGGVEASLIISRQNELQAAAAEAVAVTLSRTPQDQSERDTLEAIIEHSTGLDAANVTLAKRFRCDSSANLLSDASTCGTTSVISEYILINMRDSYTPVWSNFGIGRPINFDITRRVQIS